ncbi:MAG: hypothetical protein ACP5T2_06810, partial [Thermoprotei archaeon]
VRYAANSILARALDVYTSALLPREYKLEELKQLRYEAANFSLNPRPSLVLQGGIRVPSLVELVKKQNAEQNYANLASLYGDTVDIYTYMIMGYVSSRVQVLIDRLSGGR